MKKIALFCLTAVVFLLAVLSLVQGKRPFRHLQGSDIAEAKVTITPPDVTLLVPDNDRLAALLQNITLYQQDNSYTEYTGQGALFTLTMTDGTTTELLAYAPFFVIDGAGYRTKEAPCDACSQYANTLLDDPSLLLLEFPPALSVQSSNTAMAAYLTRTHWQQNDNHFITKQEQDLMVLETSDSTASLTFAQKPDQILSVLAQPLDDTSAAFVPVSCANDAIILLPGTYRYEVTAHWAEQNGCGGFAVYTFSIQTN